MSIIYLQAYVTFNPQGLHTLDKLTQSEPGYTTRVVIGFNVTSSGIYYATGQMESEQFSILNLDRLTYKIESEDDIKNVFDLCSYLIRDLATKFPNAGFAYLASSAGQMGSGIETIKAETLLQLAIILNGKSPTKVTPQRLPRALGCAKKQNWKDRITELFNQGGPHKYWSAGSNGAVAAAYVANT